MMRATLVFVLFMSLASWVNWDLWTRRPDLTSLPVDRSPQMVGAAAELPANLVRFDATLLQTYARPLFEPSRRPYEPPIIDPIFLSEVHEDEPLITDIAVNSELPALSIFGIQRTPSRGQALLQLDGESEPTWHSEADVIGGWILKHIGEVQLTFTRNGQDAIVELYPDVKPADGIN